MTPNTPEQQEEEVENRHKQRKTLEERKKQRFVYGNYHLYYGYRNVGTIEEDPRLKYFKKDWFQGRDCLDVGCNTGMLTISIAKKFSCRKILGIDIDPALIGRAQKLLNFTAKRSLKEATNGQINKNPVLDVNSLEEKSHIDADSEPSDGPESSSLCDGLNGDELLKRVTFRTENFIECLESSATYDTVLCLSVTKWIHLNWGDDGLLRLFAKIKHLLQPGSGILVLEPQPWKSYKNKRWVSEVTRKNFDEIKLHPKDFREVLLDKVGYRSMESITQEIVDSNVGFNRPIFLLRT